MTFPDGEVDPTRAEFDRIAVHLGNLNRLDALLNGRADNRVCSEGLSEDESLEYVRMQISNGSEDLQAQDDTVVIGDLNANSKRIIRDLYQETDARIERTVKMGVGYCQVLSGVYDEYNVFFVERHSSITLDGGRVVQPTVTLKAYADEPYELFMADWDEASIFMLQDLQGRQAIERCRELGRKAGGAAMSLMQSFWKLHPSFWLDR